MEVEVERAQCIKSMQAKMEVVRIGVVLGLISVTRLGDLLDFGQLLKAFGKN